MRPRLLSARLGLASQLGSLVIGPTSHKFITSDVKRILWLYYDPITPFLICASNELFFVPLYLAYWVTTPISLSVSASLPLLEGLTWPEIIALLRCSIFILKNIVDIVRLWKASKILVGVDLAERAKAREETKGFKI